MKNLFFFTGDNTQALQEKLKFWQHEFVKKHEPSNVTIYDEVKQKDLADIISTVETHPFLSDKRMVIIKGLPQAANAKPKLETEILEDLLKDIPETSLVIFASSKPDKRTRFYKQLTKAAQVESFDLPKGRELGDWVLARLKARGKDIEAQALNLLIFSCAENLGRLAGEVEKLSLLETEFLTTSDIERCVSSTPEAKIFKVLDLMGKTTSHELLLEFQQLIKSGEDIMLVFFMIVRQFRLLIQMRSLLDRQASRAEIQKRLKLAPFQVGMLSQQAERFHQEKLKGVYQQLVDIDYQIKTGGIPLTTDNDELLHLRIDQFLCSLSE